VAVRNERSDLEEQAEKLLQETFGNKALLDELQNSLLKELSTATGNILDNPVLLETLERAKIKAVEVN
jgi:dynein heavy chain